MIFIDDSYVSSVDEVVIAPVRDLALLLRDVVASVLVQKGKADIPGQTEGHPATSIGPRVPPVGSPQQRDRQPTPGDRGSRLQGRASACDHRDGFGQRRYCRLPSPVRGGRLFRPSRRRECRASALRAGSPHIRFISPQSFFLTKMDRDSKLDYNSRWRVQ